jgi:hypothetical protein
MVATPEGPVESSFLAARTESSLARRVRRGLFVLDPSVDADVRHLDVDLGGDLDYIVATPVQSFGRYQLDNPGHDLCGCGFGK